MLGFQSTTGIILYSVSVAGCLGYDVLGATITLISQDSAVSVAGCLGYDVLESFHITLSTLLGFQLLVV